MIASVLILAFSLLLVVVGADKLVDGASAIARKAGVSEFVIGLTIVGFGTSCPELVVSLTGAFEGLSDVALGNVVGSNIFNTLLILGLTAVLSPIAITDSNRKIDIPVVIAVTLGLCLLAISGRISRISGIGFLVLFAAYLYYCFKSDNGNVVESIDKTASLGRGIVYTLLGLAFLIVGGKFFVDKAVEIARALNVSEKFISITLLAGGTSLPELVTCVVAAAKHRDQLALGNILGSNVFNILLILGCSAIVRPIDCSGLDWLDMTTLMASAVVLLVAAYTGKRNRLDRWEGAVLLLLEAVYITMLFVRL